MQWRSYPEFQGGAKLKIYYIQRFKSTSPQQSMRYFVPIKSEGSKPPPS